MQKWAVALVLYAGALSCGGRAELDLMPEAASPTPPGGSGSSGPAVPPPPPMGTPSVPTAVPPVQPPPSEPPPSEPPPYHLPPIPCAEGEEVQAPRELVAERLSQVLWGQPADPALIRRVTAFRYYTHGTIGCLAREMLDKDPRSAQGLASFYMGWLDRRRAPDESYVSSERVPEFSPELVVAAREATVQFILEVLGGPSTLGLGTFAALLTSPDFWRQSPSLDFIYANDASLRAEQERAGLFAQPYFLMTRSSLDRGSPAQRGASLGYSLYCHGGPPAPPPGARGTLEIPSELTTREGVEQAYGGNPACLSCHDYVGRPGYAFEHFDVLGRYRDEEAGKRIDSATTVIAFPPQVSGADPQDRMNVSGLGDLMNYVANNPGAEQCHLAHWLAYARTLDFESDRYAALLRQPDLATIEYAMRRASLGSANRLQIKEALIALTERPGFFAK
jgi:hypothetical protein